jgi:DNA (cytosine-5)-methyltransferase 1
MHKFPYKWNLSDGYPAKNIEAHGLKVFGTFINGGGSTMGYKLAGYHHLGGVEIDPQVADIYETNHKPKYLYTQDIRDFNERTDLPEELYNLDILDGSPPCSTFSMAGSREEAWGKEKVFREGQAKQRLDDLVFTYIETINKLKPKVAILENVKGMIAGNAKAYVKEAVRRLNDYGYSVQVFLLNAASMGVPQKRERVFFVCSRKELKYPKLKMEFNEKAITFGEIEDKSDCTERLDRGSQSYLLWGLTSRGESFSKHHEKGTFFGYRKTDPNKTLGTIVSSNGTQEWHYKNYRTLNDKELKQAGSYPLDYNFKSIEPKYLIGMSVPPVMMAQISHQIYLQWFKG